MSTRTRPVRKATVNARYVTDGTYPDGPPVSALERAVHKLNRESFRSNVLAYVDNILVRALFTSKKRYHSSKAMELSMVGTLGCLPSECTDMARLINGGIVDRQDPSPEQCRQAAQRLQEAFPHVFGEEHRRPLEHLLLRYLLLYSAHSLVRLDKVRLDGEGFCAGLRAVRSIEAGQVLLTTCSSMASDAAAADLGRLSVIRPTSSSAGRPCDRLILGPFRFANHDCRPNAQIMAVPKTHAFVLCAVLDIPEGRPVTVSYSVGGYGDYLGEVAECACASCHPDRPPERTHGKGGSE